VRKTCSILAISVVLLTLLGGVRSATAQQTQSLVRQEDPIVALFGGYLPGGEVESGFGGVLMTVGSKYDVGFVYSAAPNVLAYGGQIGALLSTPGESAVQVRLGGNLQSVQLEAGGGENFSSLAGGISLTAGLPLRGEALFARPAGSFLLSYVPTIGTGGFRDEPTLRHDIQPSGSVGLAVGVYGSKGAIVVEPVLTFPIQSDTQQEVSYGISASILLGMR
jgi:hypothetical protein